MPLPFMCLCAVFFLCFPHQATSSPSSQSSPSAAAANTSLLVVSFSSDGSAAYLGRNALPPSTTSTTTKSSHITNRLTPHPAGLPAPVDFFGDHSQQPQALAVAISKGVALALTNGGTELYSWTTPKNSSESALGRPISSQQGQGAPANRPGQIQLKHSERFTMVAAGLDHAVALSEDGTLYTWGGNEYHQLARPSSRTDHCRAGPNCTDPSVQVAETSRTFTHVDAGPFYGVAALKMPHRGAVAWGLTACGVDLPLPDHEKNGRYYVHGFEPARRLGSVVGLERMSIVRVAAGGRHSAFLTEDGRLFTCATGFDELGNAVTERLPGSVPPTQVPSLTKLNHYGELGRDDEHISKPMDIGPVDSVLSTQTRFKDIALGKCYSLAVDTDGTLWSWGCQGALLRTCDFLHPGARSVSKLRSRVDEYASFVYKGDSVSKGDPHKLWKMEKAYAETRADLEERAGAWRQCLRHPRPVPWKHLIGRARQAGDAVSLLAAGATTAAAILKSNELLVWGRHEETWGGVNGTHSSNVPMSAVNLSKRARKQVKGAGIWTDAKPLHLAAGEETFLYVVETKLPSLSPSL